MPTIIITKVDNILCAQSVLLSTFCNVIRNNKLSETWLFTPSSDAKATSLTFLIPKTPNFSTVKKPKKSLKA